LESYNPTAKRPDYSILIHLRSSQHTSWSFDRHFSPVAWQFKLDYTLEEWFLSF